MPLKLLTALQVCCAIYKTTSCVSTQFKVILLIFFSPWNYHHEWWGSTRTLWQLLWRCLCWMWRQSIIIMLFTLFSCSFFLTINNYYCSMVRLKKWMSVTILEIILLAMFTSRFVWHDKIRGQSCLLNSCVCFHSFVKRKMLRRPLAIWTIGGLPVVPSMPSWVLSLIFVKLAVVSMNSGEFWSSSW